MFENIAAIDIGSYAVKLVKIRTGLKDFQVKSFAYEDIDQENDDALDAAKEAIRKILAEENLKGFNVVTNLPMEKEIIRNITFPFSDVEKIAEAIPFEAEENIPFKLDDLVLDFQSLKSRNDSEGRILLAAAHKESLYDFLRVLEDCEIRPVNMGMEANALFECYKYFNKIPDESIMQLDIGNNKTIINFVANNRLIYTRSISIGLNLIHRSIMEIMKTGYSEAVRLFHHLNVDLTSYENNIQRNYYSSLGVQKPKFKKIYDSIIEILNELVEQIILTVKAVGQDCGSIEFSRILLSGGGSNISGIGSVLSREMELPIVALPFLDEYKEQKVISQFPIAFGTVLCYMNARKSSINFLKGEFLPDIARESKKIYYLAGMFGVLTLIALIMNFIISLVLTYRSNQQYNKLLAEKYKRYFHTNPQSDDPLTDAMKILRKEKKELQNINQFMSNDTSFLELLNEILVSFPRMNDFVLNNLVYNERVIAIDGTAAESTEVDSFKERLIKSKKYESVTLNIKYSRNREVKFTLTIKQKLKGAPKKTATGGSE